MATIIYGKNATRDSLLTKKAKRVYVSVRLKNDSFLKSLPLNGIEVKFVLDNELDKLASSPNHQGYAALVDDFKTYALDDLIASAKSKPYPLLAILDGIEDPHNLGAIIRSADAFGVDGIIMKKRGEVPLNATVAKVSTGAIDYVKVAVVNNLSNAIRTLKEAGYWIVSSDGEAKTLYDEVDYRSPIAVVIGSEGFGVSRLVKDNSDFLVKIPMTGHVNSLNASVAASIMFSEICRSRREK